MLTLTLFSLVAHIDENLIEFIARYGAWVYALLFLIIFCETGLVVFPFLPGDSLLFIAGSLAAAGEGLQLPWLIPVLLIAAWLGDTVNYWIGRRIGPQVFRWENSRFFNRAAFEKTHDFYERHGGKTIVLARFMPIVRTFAPFVAGVALMNYRYFTLLNVLGGALWIVSLTLAGYWFGSLPWVRKNLFFITMLIIVISFLPLAWGIWRNYLRRKKQSAPSHEP